MTSITLSLGVILFWLLVYLRRRHVRNANSTTLLPLTTGPSASRSLLRLGRHTVLDLPSPFVLRLESTALTQTHVRLLEVTARKRGRVSNYNLGRAVRSFYDLGSVVAILGQVLGFLGLLWAIFRLGHHVLSGGTPSHVAAQNLLAKRAPVFEPVSNDLILKPLIPGLTLPLSHLPSILASLIVCTAIHELGHAIAAAADGIPLVSWGYSLILVIPIAFVELSASASRPEPSLKHRLRIASAGAYHNLISIFVLFLLSALSLGHIIWPLLGYQEVTAGVVVVDVQKDSPLRPHLTTGLIITSIDDTPLVASSNNSVQDVWTKIFLTKDADLSFEKGWCVERDWFDAHSQACCPYSSTRKPEHETRSCFIPQPPSFGAGRCIEPLFLLEDRERERCTSGASCSGLDGEVDYSKDTSHEQMCIIPHSLAMLLRISFYRTEGGQKTIVWRGPKKEVWEQVTTGKYLPRFGFLPVGLPYTAELLLHYLSTVSISLFFFNLLPVRILDGGEILSVLLCWALRENDEEDEDLEMGRGGQDRRTPLWTRRARKVQSVVEIVTVGMVVIVFVGGLFALGIG